MRRTAAILLAFALAPGLWWRTDLPPEDHDAPVTIERLAGVAEQGGTLAWEAGWVLDSRRPRFGGYSALVSLGPSGLLAASDGGQLLFVSLSGGAPVAARIEPFIRRGGPEMKRAFDLEALARDPRDGTLWLAAERSNLVLRFDAALRPTGRAAPQAMAGWRNNGGAEAMTRLADGRFVVLQEAASRRLGDEHRGLMFAGDPTDPATPAPLAFRFLPPGGYSPVDLAQLPDGRVLVLLRRVTWPLPPLFASALAVADPAAIRRDGLWSAQRLPWNPAWPRENFEGLAVQPHPSGGLRVWLIADDNEMQRWQRTLLVALHWRPQHAPGQAKGARSPAARP